MNKKPSKFNAFNWKNSLLIIGALSFICYSIIILFLQRNNADGPSFLEDAYVFFSIIIIIFLVYSISKFIYPIISRFREKKINTLNNKFTLYFIVISLTPALIVGVLGIILINLGINDWFNYKIKNVVSNSVYVAESYLEEHRQSIKGDIYAMSNDLNNISKFYDGDRNKFMNFMKSQAIIRSLPESYLINNEGQIILKALPDKMIYYKPPDESLDRASKGDLAVLSSTEVNKVYALIKLNNYNNVFLYVGRSMDPNVISALNDTRSAKKEYADLEKNRSQISIIFILLYLIITLVLIFISTTIGVRIAQRIVNPISSIIKATNNISRGSYDNKIVRTNDYIELNRLADSFNKMSNDLVKQRKQIIIAKKYETWSDIARRIAHEIKNPLTPIQLSSERLLKKIKNIPNLNNNEINECVNSITRQVSEIRILVDEFSNFARLPNPKFEDHDICNIINQNIKNLEKNYSNIKFETINELNSLNLKCDQMQISRVLQNILINSINSINSIAGINKKNNGKIICKSSLNEDIFHIQITDNGEGIKYDKEELIKPYFSTRKKNGGTGLGLSIVEKILSDHNADFNISNNEENHPGAVVDIYFNLN